MASGSSTRVQNPENELVNRRVDTVLFYHRNTIDALLDITAG